MLETIIYTNNVQDKQSPNRNTLSPNIIKSLPEDQQRILTGCFEKTNVIVDHECQHLYVQGAKECVEMLKKLGAL